MGETVSYPGVIENEVNTGIVITGAYADKLRRTLFAQLGEYVRKSKEYAREIARASGELNKILYIAIVENLKSEKGDAVRIRIKYRYDPGVNRLTWDYNTLRIEFFKRKPDDEVNNIVKKVLETRLKEIMEEYARPGLVEETKPLVIEEKVETIRLSEIISTADPIGETTMGGVVFKLSSRSGEKLGIVSVEPRGDSWIIDAVVIYGGKAYRVYGRTDKNKQTYISDPAILVRDIASYKPVPISSEDAEKLISGKMGEIT